MALYGRPPNVLPSLTLSHAAAGDTTGAFAGLTRFVHRVRELALQSMVEGVARARVKRVLDTRAQAPGEAVDLS
eukprot:1517816-Lingulodinium_polyedra.AAC.1